MNESLQKIRQFYNDTYYSNARSPGGITAHLQSLAQRTGIQSGQDVLDVACGAGEWLIACRERGARIAGIDLSDRAIEICRQSFPDGEFHVTAAESLPFEDNRFDVVTCLGSLEHFIDPLRALAEMRRVAKPNATIIILVPNADFLTRRLGLFSGTHQTAAKEDVKTLEEWQQLFNAAGFDVIERWRDLHVLSWSWISLAGLRAVPLRAMQALALACWPLRWQYQVYHKLRIR
ncbi:2-polyprenyl-6-hydroxyphenyl methylase/3-demethylubiquinone-9 3-methyltransferase [Methylomarinovum caldicuralii]|uniref:2-polyprenyl-6-hydroxyphenyl methylase/3-demethylubiquinone-9 3-methyltransferase n=1 Tax=Methylomarinovum caldicuralii TaxID=438856 RepID=A0AAU9C8D4_9GAMM|nr:class I SAM-dependent methyltransferase [Methylomarinovum caldicuralii]BCX80689.1 2-polyprenyl-6-hydroxyphenyl methylase/3-demethylubiquinone-9 3-methyltransferase [Methylomarinovum caldicuralii]